MNKEDINNIVDETVHRPKRHKIEKTGFDNLRNWLNIIFMTGAIVGMIIYFFSDNTIGTFIILAAMVFKIVETALRFIH